MTNSSQCTDPEAMLNLLVTKLLNFEEEQRELDDYLNETVTLEQIKHSDLSTLKVKHQIKHREIIETFDEMEKLKSALDPNSSVEKEFINKLEMLISRKDLVNKLWEMKRDEIYQAYQVAYFRYQCQVLCERCDTNMDCENIDTKDFEMFRKEEEDEMRMEYESLEAYLNQMEMEKHPYVEVLSDELKEVYDIIEAVKKAFDQRTSSLNAEQTPSSESPVNISMAELIEIDSDEE